MVETSRYLYLKQGCRELPKKTFLIHCENPSTLYHYKRHRNNRLYVILAGVIPGSDEPKRDINQLFAALGWHCYQGILDCCDLPASGKVGFGS